MAAGLQRDIDPHGIEARLRQGGDAGIVAAQGGGIQGAREDLNQESQGEREDRKGDHDLQQREATLGTTAAGRPR